MKTKKLLMLMSAVAGLAATTPANAEKETYHFPGRDGDAQGILFNQTELARIPVTNDIYVTIEKGWKAGTTVTTNEVPVEVNGKTYKEEVISTNRVDVADADLVWTAPFVVRDARGNGFAKARADLNGDADILSEGISAVAMNPDSKKTYVFVNNNASHKHFYEMSLGNITASTALEINSQLNPSWTKLPFYSANNDSSNQLSIRADRAYSWGKDGVGSGEWIVTYDSTIDPSEDFNTVVLHRNGVVNRQGQFNGIEPKEVTFGTDKIYVSDGTNLVSIAKNDPTAGYETIDLAEGNQGFGVTANGIYQVDSEGNICGEDGKPVSLYFKASETSANIHWEEVEAKGAFTDMKVDDKGNVIVAYAADAEVTQETFYFEKKQKATAVSGIQKIVSAQNGVITALTKSGATIQRTYGE